MAAYVDQIFQRSSGLTGRELFTGLFRQGEDQWVHFAPKKGSRVTQDQDLCSAEYFGENTEVGFRKRSTQTAIIKNRWIANPSTVD